MGMFDSLHTGWVCGQVKCLGKGLRDLVPGDVVQLHVLPSGERLRQLCDQLAEYRAANPQVEIDELRVQPFDPRRVSGKTSYKTIHRLRRDGARWFSPGELDQLLKEVRTRDESLKRNFTRLGSAHLGRRE